MNNKIGLGLITCDRIDFFKKSLNSILTCSKNIENFELIVINDGLEKIKSSENIKIIQTNGKIGVGKAKNLALKYLMKKECEHIFLMEDDIVIKDQKAFDLYINTSKITGIKHLNYGLHGNHNRDHLGEPVVRKIVTYKDNITKINLYPNVLGAFSYYHIDCLNKIGLMDEQYYNAMEHVDHTYVAFKAGFHPPFRWFADAFGSENYLEDIVPDHKQSKIRSEENFQETFKKGLDIFIKKHNFSVIGGYGPVEYLYSEEECLKELKKIWKTHNSEKGKGYFKSILDNFWTPKADDIKKNEILNDNTVENIKEKKSDPLPDPKPEIKTEKTEVKMIKKQKIKEGKYGKIGIGVTTYNSEEYFKTLFNSLYDCEYQELVVVNGGNEYKEKYDCDWIQHNHNNYPSVCRNDAVNFLLNRGCDHIFLIEDDMIIKDKNIFEEYIKASINSGLKYFSFTSMAWDSGKPFERTPRLTVNYKNNVSVSFYKNMCNEFTYHHKSCFEKTGLYDTQFRDPFDIDMTYRESQTDYAAPFWWFADITNSDQYIQNNENAKSRLQSDRPDGSREERIKEQWQLFYKKHGKLVQEIPDINKEEVVKFLKKIMK